MSQSRAVCVVDPSAAWKKSSIGRISVLPSAVRTQKERLDDWLRRYGCGQPPSQYQRFAMQRNHELPPRFPMAGIRVRYRISMYQQYILRHILPASKSDGYSVRGDNIFRKMRNFLKLSQNLLTERFACSSYEYAPDNIVSPPCTRKICFRPQWGAG
jgi:hypothetical protein